jgi:hypothetical protein
MPAKQNQHFTHAFMGSVVRLVAVDYWQVPATGSGVHTGQPGDYIAPLPCSSVVRRRDGLLTACGHHGERRRCARPRGSRSLRAPAANCARAPQEFWVQHRSYARSSCHLHPPMLRAPRHILTASIRPRIALDDAEEWSKDHIARTLSFSNARSKLTLSVASAATRLAAL